MGYDMNRVLVEVAVTRTLRELKRDPARALRNMVDLAQRLVHGRFSKELFELIQHMLEDGHSAYYTLLEDVVGHTRLETLQTFGMNLGYDGLTRGAARIREIEAEQDFNIPWALTLEMGEGAEALTTAEWSDLLLAGKKLGVYAYMVFLPAALLPQLRELCLAHPDCALVAFVRPGQAGMEQWDFEALAALRNVMLVPSLLDPFFVPVTGELRSRGCLYSCYLEYETQDVQDLPTGQWLLPALHQHCVFTILIPRRDCPQAARAAVADYVKEEREGQRHPTLLYEFESDHMLIDEVISGSPCFVGITAEGKAFTEIAPTDDGPNVRRHTLREILRDLLPRSATA